MPRLSLLRGGGVKRRLFGLLLGCAMAASFFGIGCGLGLNALFREEKALVTNGHYGVLTLLPEETPEFDPGVNAYLTGDPRESLLRVLNVEEYRVLQKRSGAFPIRQRYMTLGVSSEYLRLLPPEGYYDYADRLIVEATVEAVGGDALTLTDCEFLGGRAETMKTEIAAELPEDLAETWQAGDRTAFSLRTWREDGAWRYRVDPELVPGGSITAEAVIQMAEDDLHGFDVVYTEDMSWIYRVAQGELFSVQGRMIEGSDAEDRVCVVSERFLRENGLELGDSLRLRLGDRLCSQFAPIGALAYTADQYPRRWAEETFEIVGSFADADNGRWTPEEFGYAYSESTVFVPLSALPDAVSRSSVRYTPAELSLLPTGGDSLGRRLELMRETAAALGLRCELDERGWPEIAAGIARAAGRIRANVWPIPAGAAALLALAFIALLLSVHRKCALLRLAGLPNKTTLKRTLLPSLVLLWAAAGIGASGAILFLRLRGPSLLEGWAAGLQISERGAPAGTVLLSAGVVSLVLSGGVLLAVLPLMKRDLRLLASETGRRAGRA